MSVGKMILCRTEDWRPEIHLRAEGDTVWSKQTEIAKLFETGPQAITQQLQAIYAEGELDPEGNCTDFLQVRQEVQRQIKLQLKSYKLPLILAVGCRVRSTRGTPFRQWATAHLNEYLVKGFVMNALISLMTNGVKPKPLRRMQSICRSWGHRKTGEM